MPRNLTAQEIQSSKLADIRAACEAEFAWIEAAEGESKLKKFSITAYTGAPMRVGFGFPVVVDLSGMTVAGESLPILKDHDATKIVGHTDSVDKSVKRLKLTGVVSGVGDAAQEVTALGANGFPWQASIGASIEQMEFVDKGESLTVNGRAITGPVYVARKSTLRETSFVAIGADAGTSGRIAASSQQKGNVMDPELKAYIESMDLDPAALSEAQVAKIKAKYDASKAKPPVEKKQTIDEIVAARAAEADRIEAFEEIFASATLGRSRAECLELKQVYDTAVESNWDVEKFKLSLHQSGRFNVPIHSRSRNEKLDDKVLEAAICLTGGLTNIDKHFSDQQLQTARDKFKNGVGIKQLYRMKARQFGYHHDDDEVTLDMHRAACGFTANGMQGMGIQASGGYSTLPLPGILSNSAYKFLLEGWGTGEMTWSEITSRRSVRDFKQVTSYKLSGNMKYVKVGAGGELTHGNVTEDSYTNQAETYGRMFAVTRTDIINDDLGALSQIPTELGIGANDAFNEVFWTEFLNNGSFFTSGNGNQSTGVLTGTTGPATIAAAELKFMLQTKPNGTPLGIMPTMMLVPPGSYRAALALMESSVVTGSTGPLPVVNTFAGNYTVHTSAYMANSAFTGYSTIIWYLLARRPGFAVIETAFLNGRETPIVETADASFNTLGIQMRAYHDFGVNLQEYRAGVQGSGA